MKFACERCRRRFSTIDEPIAGRVYYIPCKCGHVIALRTDAAGSLEPLAAVRAAAAVPPPLPQRAADPAWAEAPAARPAEDAIPEVSGAVPLPEVSGAPPIPELTGAIPVDDDPFARATPDPLPATRRFDLAALAAGGSPPLATLDPGASPEELVDTRMYEAEREGAARWRPRRSTALAAGAGAAAFAAAVAAWISVVSTGTTSSLTIARSPSAPDPGPAGAEPEWTVDLSVPAAPAPAAPVRAPPPAEPVSAPELIVLAGPAREPAFAGDALVAPQPIALAGPGAQEPAAVPAAPSAPPDAPAAVPARAAARAPDARQVFEALRGHGDDLDECIASAPDAVPAIAGKRFRLVVVVDPDGRVSDASVDDPAVDATALGTCLRGVAYAMSFQPFEGDPARVRVPLKPDDAR
jgi:hypothetical protein